MSIYTPPQKQPRPVDRLAVLDAMEKYGGGFVAHLAAAWRRADQENDAKLRAAFPHYWQQYEAMARRSLERTAGSPTAPPEEPAPDYGGALGADGQVHSDADPGL